MPEERANDVTGATKPSSQKTDSHSVSRRDFLTQTSSLIAAVPTLRRILQSPAVAGLPEASRTPLGEPPRQKRPQWWRDQGMVMAMLASPFSPFCGLAAGIWQTHS